MSLTSSSAGSYLVAIVLAILTLSVFWSAKEGGPESIVRRYHRAVMEQNINELQVLVVQEPSGDAFGASRTRIIRLAASNTRMRSTRVLIQDNLAVVEMEYSLPGVGVEALPWILRRVGRFWRIDLDQTERLLREAWAVPGS